ncbi:MAG: hypothetical protein KC621_33605 [Myxococcales bacterium]|nr:hypothetical protein [Myxococcales bacterium]
MLWIAALMAGCGKTVEGQCNRALVKLCDHEVECGLTAGFNTCMDQKREIYQCDYDKAIADYDVCIADIATANCAIALPDSCGAVLCHKDTGCIYVPQCDPEEDTGCLEETGTTVSTTCASGDTGCTKSTTTP